MSQSDIIRIQHMIDACNEAIFFADDKTRDDIANNRMLVLSVIKELEIIGEAASKISKKLIDQNQDIPGRI